MKTKVMTVVGLAVLTFSVAVLVESQGESDRILSSQPSNTNELPMYLGSSKPQFELDADAAFIERAISTAGTSATASAYYADRAWRFYQRGERRMAMKRFNQAWLLDARNFQVYWGFATLLADAGHYGGSLEMFKTAVSLKEPPQKRLVCDFADVQIRYALKTKAVASKEWSDHFRRGIKMAEEAGADCVTSISQSIGCELHQSLIDAETCAVTLN